MTQKCYSWRLAERVLIDLRIADELWFNTLTNGERVYHFVHLGYSERADAPGVRVGTLTVLGVSLNVGIDSNPRKGSR
jgi:hypothetical protein